MSLKTFSRGGVHPPTHKDATSASSIEDLPLPEKLVVPMSQHLGAPGTVDDKQLKDLNIQADFIFR